MEEIHTERLLWLDSLGPSSWFRGQNLGNTVYFVAVFERVAIADSPLFGNALYYCDASADKWKNILRREKFLALEAGAKRIYHTGDWHQRVQHLVRWGP